MIFFLSKALWYVFMPGNLLVLLLALGVLLGWTRWRKFGRGLIITATLSLLVIGSMPIANWVGSALESRFPTPKPPPEATGIILPGGYVNPWVSAARHEPALTQAAQRLVEVAILARRYPNAKVVVTGGTPIMFPDFFSGPPESEGEISKSLLIQLGVPPGRIILETKSRNTYENAVFSKRLVRPKPGQTWILVTSAASMPRAVGVFRRAGWPVLPWPAGYRTSGRLYPAGDFAVAESLEHLDVFAHEWVGLAAYWLMGRTSALFPAPRMGSGAAG